MDNKYNKVWDSSKQINNFSSKTDDNSNFYEQLTSEGSLSGEMSNPKLVVFPKELSSDAFKFRKLSIGIWKDTSFFKTIKEKIETFGSPEKIIEGITKTTGEAKESSISEVAGEIASRAIASIQTERNYPFKECEMELVLPLPNNLIEVVSHDFSSTEGLISSGFSKVPGVGNITDLGSKVGAKTNQRKIMINPDKFQNYIGSEPRRFDFNFKIVPSSLEEAASGARIAHLLKKYSSPELPGGTATTIMIQPRFFVLCFGNPVLQKLINPLPCVLTNISLSYDDGTYVSTTFDGIPKVLTLNLSFAETRTLVQDDWNI